MRPNETLQAFDQFLATKGKSFSGVIVGGAALSLMGVISRETQDVDVIDPILPKEIDALAQAFATQWKPKSALPLKKYWLNNGPESLRKDLPRGWLKRTQTIFTGKALILHALGRADFLKSKLFSLCDREQDRQDCILLKPSREELLEALPWIKSQDLNPQWPIHVERTLQSLAKELGYEL